QGGWGRKQRYPWPQPVEHAFLRALAWGDATWRARATTTLASELALIDPVWGGMYQYSVDGDWQHPHYEKITAIQAGAIHNYAMAYRVTGERRWLDASWRVARYMTAMMQDERGGFFTSQDADLRVPGRAPVLGAAYYAKDDAARRVLGIPRIDRAVYADLNGLMIEALCELFAASGEREALDAATLAARALLASHRRDDGGFEHGVRGDGPPLLYLRDQAAMGRAMLALYRVTGEPEWLDHARGLGELVLARLEDRERGGFRAHTDDPEAVGVFAQPRRPLEENGLVARFLLQLHRALDGDGSTPTPYRDAAVRALGALGDPEAIAPEGRIVGTYLLALEEATMPTVDITVVGDLGDGGTTQGLLAAALAFADPRAMVELSTPGARYPDIGEPAVYLCTETACSSPVTRRDRFAATAADFVATSVPLLTAADEQPGYAVPAR
ncbi:MAG: thioredoxin domain-containing protein, partial [Deltaproteobacteria bacterium]|nr:thioredoxin domain-containing protein [Nannocystaceae bacterium]